MGKKLLKNTEWTILIVSIILAVIGLVALYSATLSTDFVEFRKQVQWLIISIPFLILASKLSIPFRFTGFVLQHQIQTCFLP